jgi:hypothetical protein
MRQVTCQQSTTRTLVRLQFAFCILQFAFAHSADAALLIELTHRSSAPATGIPTSGPEALVLRYGVIVGDAFPPAAEIGGSFLPTDVGLVNHATPSQLATISRSARGTY